MIELAIGIGVVAVATIAAVRSRSRGIAAPLPAAPPPPPPEPAGERLGVGDVLLHLDTELWLAGCVALHEGGAVVRIFPTPGGGLTEYVAELGGSPARWLALRATDAIEPGAVPDRVRIDGIPLALERRGVARVYATGENLPPVTERAEYVLLGGPGGRHAIVVDFAGGGRLALAGDELRREMIDRLPGSLAASP